MADADERALLRAWLETADVEVGARLLLARERAGALPPAAIDCAALIGVPAACVARELAAEAELPRDVEGWLRAVATLGDDLALGLACRAASLALLDSVRGLDAPTATPPLRVSYVARIPVSGAEGVGPIHAIPAADDLLADPSDERRSELLDALWIAPGLADDAVVSATRAVVERWRLGLCRPGDHPFAARVARGELTATEIVRAARVGARQARAAIGGGGAEAGLFAVAGLPRRLAGRGALAILEQVAAADPPLQAFVDAALWAFGGAIDPPRALRAAASRLEAAEPAASLLSSNAREAALELARSQTDGAPVVHIQNALALGAVALRHQRAGAEPTATIPALDLARRTLVRERLLPDLD